MRTVIVVEDDAGSRKALARVLRAGGFDAVTYASAEEFLAGARATAPLALLLDIHLTGMSGLDLQKQLRSAGSMIPIIIITAYDDARSREQAERLGCVTYLRKPCGATEILSALRSIPGSGSS